MDESAYINNCVANAAFSDGQTVGGIVGYYSTINFETADYHLKNNFWTSGYPQIGNDDTTTPYTPENPTYTWNNHKYELFNEALTWDEAKSKWRNSADI